MDIVVPLAPEYALSVGHAVFCFARLEWEAVYVCERICPGYLESVGDKTAGQIGHDLMEKIEGMAQDSLRREFRDSAMEFRCLVREPIRIFVCEAVGKSDDRLSHAPV